MFELPFTLDQSVFSIITMKTFFIGTTNDGPAAPIVIESCLLAVCGVAAESFACTVKVKEPEAIGVPLMVPVELFSDNPPGREPTVRLQVYGVVPPEAARMVL